MIDRRLLRYFDWISFGLTLLLLGIGLLFVFSATYRPDQPFSFLFKKQLAGAGAGLLFYLFFTFKDLRNFFRAGFFIYFAILGLLLYTMVGGLIGMGGKRWVGILFLRFQPSELVKLFLPVFIAYYFCEEKVFKYRILLPTRMPLQQFIFPLGVLFINFFLVYKQPDLGTALITLFSGMALLWFVGLDKKFFMVAGLLCIVAAPVLWKFLRPYQQNRILVMFGHGDARKERYQLEQSKIAIGSGGLCGKGLLRGTQNKLEFLPEDHTDFIFSVICEECGFIGAFVVILLFILLFLRVFYVTSMVESFFEQIIALGLLMPILFSVLVNIGMVAGMLPIVGIPLPLVSYGLTNLWITLASLGWLNNIAIRRFYY